jgi:hypothetical protein
MPPAFRRSQTIKPGSDADAEEGRKQAQRSEKRSPFFPDIVLRSLRLFAANTDCASETGGPEFSALRVLM